MNEAQLKAIVERVLSGWEDQAPPLPQPPAFCPPLPVAVSARHVHLTREAAQRLFGKETALTQENPLSQPGECGSGRRVQLVTSKGMLENVAVLACAHEAVQAELSLTDCRALGIQAPVRLSGDLRGAADVFLIGPAGMLEARGSVITAQNHIHMTPADAGRFGLRDGQTLRVRVNTARPLTFERVALRVNEKRASALHIDADEACACAWEPGVTGTILPAAHDHAPAVPDPAPAPAPPEDRLITEARAKELARAGGKLRLRKGTIITPAARDVLSAARVEVEWL
jgi:propanediol utilization protein